MKGNAYYVLYGDLPVWGDASTTLRGAAVLVEVEV